MSNSLEKRTKFATATNSMVVRDSDSGHGRTSSSSASNSSSEELSDNQQNEQFDDATDELPTQVECKNDLYGLTSAQSNSENESAIKLDESEETDDETVELRIRLDETAEVLKMGLNNEFVKALSICSRKAHKELYASLANATLSFLRATLTLEPEDLQAAISAINQSLEVSSRKRRKTSAATIMMRFLYRTNYDSYTDDQIHAELVNAESLLLLALISFLSDQSIICLVKGAFRIRACYQRYKECSYIMDNRQVWGSDEAKKHFESGVRMGHGVFNLLMSYLPRRVLSFLEYVGLSGNRTIGVEELDKSIASEDGLRSVISALFVLTYHSYVENIFGLGNYDANKVKELNDSLLCDYPNSAFFLLYRGRYNQMEGHLEDAIDSFQQCIQAQDDWKQFHSICHWEIMWCYAVKMDWSKAAYYSDLLRKQSKWSPASYTYQYATFLYAKLVEEERQGLFDCPAKIEEYENRFEEIKNLMNTVPDLRIRYAGKTIPAEKFAITRSMKFLEQKGRLSLPALEFLYIWNIFVTLRNNPIQVERLLTKINSEIEYIEDKINQNNNRSDYTRDDGNDRTQDGQCNDDDGDDNWTDDLSLVLLLKGMCLKYLNRLDEAEDSFMKVIEKESDIRVDTFLVPHTIMELSLLKITLKQYDEAKQWIKLARNNYTGYLLETMVHFRLHAASRVIRLEQKNNLLTDSSTELEDQTKKIDQLNIKENSIEASPAS